jgi:endonuclease YncB( thermonuclease family)
VEHAGTVKRRTAPGRSIVRSGLDAIVFIAAVALILFGLKVFERTFIDIAGGARAIDGDSLRQGDTDIRLYGIDAPEYLQSCEDEANQAWPCGREAAAFLRNLLRGRTVSCTPRDTDRYGRLVAICEAGGLSLNEAMVREGWAIAYRRHSLDYIGLEGEARRAKRGIWSGRFEEPEKWRRREEAARETQANGTD